MRTIECDICGEPISADRRRGAGAPAEGPPDRGARRDAADDEVQQTIDREAYDAMDS